MKKISLLLLVVFCFLQCKTPKDKTYDSFTVEKYAEIIEKNSLKEKLFTIAADSFEGRETGELGQKKAAAYLKDFYEKHHISPGNNGKYYQEIPSAYFDYKFKDTENVIAMIEGHEFPEEIITVSAHYDHLGIDDNGEIYNGADDDGSGTVAVMQMAKAFKEASENGHGPRRTIVFMHFTGEEKGLLGSRYYTENPIFPLAKTVTNLNIDMIGRIDDFHQTDQHYVYLIGSDRLSSELDSVINQQNRAHTQLKLDYKYNDEDDPQRLYYRSDHYNFAKHNIPVAFFFSGLHEDYHKISDTADKIEYDLMTERAKLVFYSLWEIANSDKKLKVDKAS